MDNIKVAIIVGSLRKESYNRAVAHALTKLFPTNFSFEFINISDLPLYNQDDDTNVSTVVQNFKSEIQQCHSVIFVTPEYNRSIPGVLKNAIDQGSRPYGQSVWNGKPAGIIGVSPGNISTAIAQQHLRNSIAFLNMPTLNQPECFLKWSDDMINEKGEFSERTGNFMQAWVDAYIAFVKHQ